MSKGVNNHKTNATLLQELKSAKDEIRRLRASSIITHVAKPFILRANGFVGPTAKERFTALDKWHQGVQDEIDECFEGMEEDYKSRHLTDPCRVAFRHAYREYHDFIGLSNAIDAVAKQ